MLKKIIIIILSILIALDAGLLVYGSIGSSDALVSDLKDANVAPTAIQRDYGTISWQPATALFRPLQSSVEDPRPAWNDIDAIYASDLSKADKAAAMFVNASYNHLYCKQFAYIGKTNVSARGAEVYFETLWVENGVNRFYQSQSHTDPLNSNYSHRIIYYYDQRIEATTTNGNYNAEGKTFDMKWVGYKAKETAPKHALVTPAITRKYFKYPIDFTYNEDDDDLRIDASRLDESTVVISSSKAYYTITFQANITAVNKSKLTKDNFIDATGDAVSSPEFSSLSTTITIWKDIGLIRSIQTDIEFSATISGKKRSGTAQSELIFSYSDRDTCVAYSIKNTGAYDELSDENKARIEQEIAAAIKEEDEE